MDIPRPKPEEIITHVPSPEEADELIAKQSHIEDTVSVGALKSIYAGSKEHAADLNQRFPINRGSDYRSEPQRTEPAEPFETPEHERRLSKEEHKALLEQLRQEDEI